MIDQEPTWKADLRNFAAALDRRRLDALAQSLRQRLSRRGIIALVAECYGYRPDDLTGRGCRGDVVEARRVACLICRRQMPAVSLTQIGRAVRRDHSTVIYHLRRAEQPGFDWEPVRSIEAILARIRSESNIIPLQRGAIRA